MEEETLEGRVHLLGGKGPEKGLFRRVIGIVPDEGIYVCAGAESRF